MKFDSRCVALMRHAVAECLRELGVNPMAEVGITLVDNEEIARYNMRYRQTEGPTDVLAFPLADDVQPLGESPWFALPPTALGGLPPVLLGDIVISVEYAAAQANARGISLDEELVRLTIHGCLHLLGYDHEAEAGAEKMQGLERKLMAAVGFDTGAGDP